MVDGEWGEAMMNIMEIDDYRAVIQYDPEIEMFRGEFIGLNGGADFYAADIEGLRTEGAISLKVFLEMCREDGVPPALASVIDVHVTDDSLRVDLADGRSITVPVGWYPRLSHGTAKERANFQISGAGYGIHWPDLDEDIGVGGIVLGRKSMEGPKSFACWLASRYAQ